MFVGLLATSSFYTWGYLTSLLTLCIETLPYLIFVDGDSEHIPAADISKLVVLDESKDAEGPSKSSSAPAPKSRPKRKVTLKPRPVNTTKATKDDNKKMKSHRTKRKSSGGDDGSDGESPPLKKPAPKPSATRRSKRAAAIEKSPSPVKTKFGRIIKSTTVNIDGFAVKRGNNYEVGAESYEFSAPPARKKKQTASKANGKAKPTKAASKRVVTEAERMRSEHNNEVKKREDAAAVLRRGFFADNVNCLAKFIGPKLVQALKSEADAQITCSDGPDEVMQPDLIEGELRDYQLDGLNWMLRMFRRGMPMILGDEMGKYHRPYRM